MVRMWIGGVATLMGLCGPAAADGVAFGYRDLWGLQPAEQHDQVAIIRHVDGVQRMLIQIGVRLDDAEHGLWLFPLPATPARTRIDLAAHFPELQGRDPLLRARGSLATLLDMARATQLYPIVVQGHLDARIGGVAADAQVHAQVDRYGLRCELLQAASAADLAAHLQAQLPALRPADVEPFAPYCNDQHVLVATWVRSADELRAAFPGRAERDPEGLRRPSVYVEFATDRPFYPMRPTAAYGHELIRVRLLLLGYWQPRGALPAEARVRMLRGTRPAVWPAEPLLAGIAPERELEHTLVQLWTPADSFRQDWWFEPAGPPPGWAYADWLQRLMAPPYVLITWALLVGAISYVCAGITGLIVVRRWRQPALLGLFNIGTLLGLILALRYGQRRGGADGSAGRARRPGAVFVLLFSILFLAATVGLEHLLARPLHAG